MKKPLVNIFVFTSAVILAVEACTEGDIRLVGRVHTNDHEGHVEVCHNSVWGTVCDNSWDSNDGRVACRQLGLGFVDVVSFGQGTGQIWLDNLSCLGSETRLVDCHHNGFGVHNCGHYAGVICEVTSPTNDDSSSSNGTSTSAIISAIIGVLVIIAVFCMMCLAYSYLKYYQLRQRNFIAQQRHPRILITRLTHTSTVPSGTSPPPPYTPPTQPTSEYTPVPPRGYQPVATDEYTTTPAVPSSDDIPSEPPPKYTSSVC
ncbi:uncharacterized protein [Dysidea avara]|uniref:uncharacterized protein isoform X2 n=1 Tax=Dysidea avara TaxID=196820 RepID=UPI003327C637